MKCYISAFFIALIFMARLGITAPPLPPIPGNILATYNSRIYEITTAGVIRQTIEVPAMTVDSSTRKLGDIVYDPAGLIHVRINAPFVPSQTSTLNVATGTWIDTPVSNYNAGGRNLEMAQLGNKLYTESNQFDLVTRTSVSIKPTMHFSHPQDSGQNITLGQDGFFYATSDFTPASAIYRIDPATYEQVGGALTTVNPIDSPLNVLGMAVKPNGDYYVADFEGRVFAFTRDSVYITSSVAIGQGPADLSLSPTGLLAFGQSDVGDNFGKLAILNPNLQVVGQITLQTSSITDAMYTTFVIPEPHGLFMVSLIGLLGFARLPRPRTPRRLSLAKISGCPCCSHIGRHSSSCLCDLVVKNNPIPSVVEKPMGEFWTTEQAIRVIRVIGGQSAIRNPQFAFPTNQRLTTNPLRPVPPSLLTPIPL